MLLYRNNSAGGFTIYQEGDLHMNGKKQFVSIILAKVNSEIEAKLFIQEEKERVEKLESE